MQRFYKKYRLEYQFEQSFYVKGNWLKSIHTIIPPGDSYALISAVVDSVSKFTRVVSSMNQGWRSNYCSFFFSYNNKKKGGKWEWKYLVFVFVLMPNILPGYKKTLAWHQLHAVFREYREHQYPELVKGASACISYKTLASCILLFLARRLMNLLTKWHFAFDSLVDSWSWRRWMAWQIHRIASRWCDCKRCISSQLPASTAFIESSSLFSGGPGLFFLLEILFVRI